MPPNDPPAPLDELDIALNSLTPYRPPLSPTTPLSSSARRAAWRSFRAYLRREAKATSPRKRAVPDLAIQTPAKFATVHRALATHVERYRARRDRRNKVLISEAAAEMQPDMARYMFASHAESRITVADTLLEVLHTNAAVTAGPVQFVTVVPVRFMLTMEAALAMTLAERVALVTRLQALVRQALKGMPFIGMIEPALYKNWGPNGVMLRRDGLFWHAHVLVWGLQAGTVLRRARNNIGKRHRNLLGGTPVWVKAIKPYELDIYALYLGKTPMKHYRLHPTRGEEIDDETGEVFTTTGYRQRKDAMGVGDRILVANAMAGLTLDHLLFAGGDGLPLAKAIKDQTLAAFRMEERREKEAAHRSRTRRAGR